MLPSDENKQNLLGLKRVLLITPFYKVQRGNSLTVDRIKRGLSEKGFSLEVLTMEQPGWLSSLKTAVQEQRYAMIHGFHGVYFGQVLEMVPQINKLPLLLTTTGTDLNLDLKGAQRPVVLKALDAVRKIIIFNDDMRKIIVELSPCLKEKLVTIPQGVSLYGNNRGIRQDFGLDENNIVFLLPSGLRAVKNIDLAIDALEKVHQEYPEVRLVIIGAVIDHDYADYIKKRLIKLSWVSYLGEIPHDQMKNILFHGDIVLNTSNSEGQPQGALEAMSLGKPAILSSVPGNLNLITHGVEGFYQRNEKELIRAAKTLIVNADLRKEMGIAAQKMVEAKFAVEKERDAYTEVYRQLLS